VAGSLDVAVARPKAEIPPDGEDDHLGWEPEAGEGRLKPAKSKTPRKLMNTA
jgi:hypothetical protein